MKNKLTVLFAFIILAGCSSDDDSKDSENFVGNKYAHILFETREECESSWEMYFMNCAQTLEVINESQVEIMLTDIIYRANFYIENEKLIIQSSPDTYEFPQDLIFHISEDGNLKLDETIWVKYEEDIYEIYD